MTPASSDSRIRLSTSTTRVLSISDMASCRSLLSPTDQRGAGRMIRWPASGEADVLLGQRPFVAGGGGERQPDMHDGAASGLAVDREAAAEPLGELLAERQPQAKALARGISAGDLAERGEHGGDVVLGDADAVVRDGERHRVRAELGGELAVPAGLGELERVGDQVEP